jgi:segregation and condensation protein B
MSLKAKVEAVVYAAEEPVTLAQLAGIFANEVLEELEAEANQSPEERPQRLPQDLGEPSGEEPPQRFLQEMLPSDALPREGSGAELFAAEQGGQAPVPAAQEAPPDIEQPFPAQAAETTGEKEEEKIDEKKASRQRDRQVRDVLQKILDQLIAEYANGQRGIEIREIAGGYRMATKPEYHDAVRAFVKSLKPPMKLSLQALETLAVIAYKQPVTAPEVSEIRGVDSGGVLGSLISRKLITTAGRKHVIGRPILYKTTKEFLLRFGLKDLNELPSMEEFEKMAGELAQAEAEAEDAAMRSSEPPPAEAEAGQQTAEEKQTETQQTEAEQPGEERITEIRESEETEIQNPQRLADQAVLMNTAVVTEELVSRAGSDEEESTEQVGSDEAPFISLGSAPFPDHVQIEPAAEPESVEPTGEPETVEIAAEAAHIESLAEAAEVLPSEEALHVDSDENPVEAEPVQAEHIQDEPQAAHYEQASGRRTETRIDE